MVARWRPGVGSGSGSGSRARVAPAPESRPDAMAAGGAAGSKPTPCGEQRRRAGAWCSRWDAEDNGGGGAARPARFSRFFCRFSCSWVGESSNSRSSCRFCCLRTTWVFSDDTVDAFWIMSWNMMLLFLERPYI